MSFVAPDWLSAPVWVCTPECKDKIRNMRANVSMGTSMHNILGLYFYKIATVKYSRRELRQFPVTVSTMDGYTVYVKLPCNRVSALINTSNCGSLDNERVDAHIRYEIGSQHYIM